MISTREFRRSPLKMVIYSGFPIENGEFIVDLPIQNWDFPIENGPVGIVDLPIEHDDFPVCKV